MFYITADPKSTNVFLEFLSPDNFAIKTCYFAEGNASAMIKETMQC